MIGCAVGGLDGAALTMTPAVCAGPDLTFAATDADGNTIRNIVFASGYSTVPTAYAGARNAVVK